MSDNNNNIKMNQEQVAHHVKEMENIFEFLSVDDVKNGRTYISSEDFPTAIQLIRERVLAKIPHENEIRQLQEQLYSVNKWIEKLFPDDIRDLEGSETKREKLKYMMGLKSKYQPPSNVKFYSEGNDEIINTIINI